VVSDVPKVLAEVAGRPFLAHLLDRLAAVGLRRVILAVGYKRELVMERFGDRWGGMHIGYSIEDEPLGTGGAMRQALALVGPGPCFVLNGDTWLDLDYAGMLDAHRQADTRLSLAVRSVDDVARFGALHIVGGRVTGFLEKGPSGPGTINAGVYLLAADLLLEAQVPERFSFESDFLANELGRLRPLAFPAQGEFIDIGVPDDYFRAQRLFAARG
jgi:D-glycero-alpha-D-manno-heptose 1-phosphate guanylyltransferase